MCINFLVSVIQEFYCVNGYYDVAGLMHACLAIGIILDVHDMFLLLMWEA